MKQLLGFLFGVILIQCYAQEGINWRAYKDSIRHYAALENVDKCIFYYDKLIELNPNSTFDILSKGSLLHDFKQCRPAIKEFSRALNINPELVDAMVRRGRSYLCLGLYDSCILDFNAALGKYTYQDSAIYLYRRYAYELSANKINAELDHDSALKFQKSIKELHNSYGLVKFEMQNLEGAINEFNKAIQIDPTYLPAIKNRAIANLTLGRNNDAFKDCEFYLRHLPDDRTINYIFAACAFERKDYKSALVYVEKSKGNIRTKRAYYLSGMANYYLVSDAAAINDLTIALKLNPTNEEERSIYYIIGVCKNNIKPKSGCDDILKAFQKGLGDAQRTYSSDCK